MVLLTALLVAACAPIHTVVRHDTVDAWDAPGGNRIAWFTPSATGDEARLMRWRVAVGPPLVKEMAPRDEVARDRLTVVSWNMANGRGDVLTLVRSLEPAGPLVMLLQEAYRDGPEVPSSLPPQAAFAGRLGGANAAPYSQDVEAIAAALDLNVFYVPSMRNGGESSDEDRGNAILSNLPLTDFIAVELPFERQRRVAVAATIHARSAAGGRWSLRVASAHLDNMGSRRHGWLGGEYGRTRQARALRDVLGPQTPTVLGADLNTWFGFSEKAYIETQLAFPQTRVIDERPTFRGLLRLDHMFFRLAPQWEASFTRGAQRFGSDHYPLVGSLRIQ